MSFEITSSWGHWVKYSSNFCLDIFNSLTSEQCGYNFKCVVFKHILFISSASFSCEMVRSGCNRTPLIDGVNIGLGNGLVPDGTKPLPNLMLKKNYITISRPWWVNPFHAVVYWWIDSILLSCFMYTCIVIINKNTSAETSFMDHIQHYHIC